MAQRPFPRSVGGSGTGPDPPSVLFQKLSGDYPDLPRRVVGEVLGRVYGAAWESAPDPLRLQQLDTAARALLDAMRVRVADAPPAPPYPKGDGPRKSPGVELRDAFDPVHDGPERTRAERLSAGIETRARVLGLTPGMSLLCEAAVEFLQVAAVAVSVPVDLAGAQTLGAAGDLARPLEELQVVLGEGPSFDGLRHGTAVLVDDLTAAQPRTRWPLYAPVATDHGVRAQFVFPMQVGAARFGVLVLYLEQAGALWSTELGDARVFAEVALSWLIDDVATDSSDDLGAARARQRFLDDRAEIHQATGMVSIQLGVSLSSALLRIRARAFAEDRMLSELSAAVVARTVRFQPDDDDRTGSQHEETP